MGLNRAAWAGWLAAALVFAGSASAQEAERPWPRASGFLELGLDRGGDGGDAFVEGELAIGVPLASFALLDGVLALEDEGLFVETLALRLGGGAWGVTLGKFTPAFGLAWQEAPGVFGADFAEEHELSERVGFGLDLATRVAEAGRARLSFAAFARDRSVFSGSLLRDRGRLRRADGGAGNHRGPRSFALALDLHDAMGVPSLHAHLGWLSQPAEGAGRSHEIALALSARRPLGVGFEIVPLAELVFTAARAAPDRPDWQSTVAVALDRGPVAFSLAHAARAARGGPVAQRFAASLDWMVPTGNGRARIELALGAALDTRGGARSETVGLQLRLTMGEPG